MISLENCTFRTRFGRDIRGGIRQRGAVRALNNASFGAYGGQCPVFWLKIGIQPSVKVDRWGVVRLQYTLAY